jgi:hypothetical protein
MPHPVRRVHKNSLGPVPFDTIHVPKAMVRKTHSEPQTSLPVLQLPGLLLSNLHKTNRLGDIRLSPQLSPLFPCTSCGKPVPTYRGLQALSVVIPGCPSFHSRARLPTFATGQFRVRGPVSGSPQQAGQDSQIFPTCFALPTENVKLVLETAHFASISNRYFLGY